MVGKVTGKINGVFDRIFNVFDKINEMIGMIIKRVLIFVGGVLLLVLVLQLVMAASAAITTTVQSLFETSKGADVSEKDVMKSAGGEILTALTNKDEKWLDDDVYGLGGKKPAEIKGKKIYGGTDPKTGKKIEITEFGVKGEEIPGVSINFYNGDAYTDITGKTPNPIIEGNDASSKLKNSSIVKAQSSSVSIKKAANKNNNTSKDSENTYKGDKIVYASKRNRKKMAPKKKSCRKI